MDTIEFNDLTINNLMPLYQVAEDFYTAHIAQVLQALPTIPEKVEYIYSLMPEFEQEVKQMIKEDADDPEWYVRVPAWVKISQ